MENKKKFYFDVKWLFIIAIVGFLLVFQVFPLLYLLIRAFFADGSFSLDAFTRIYSTQMNWSCVLNTLITASLSMVFGVLIAFPLAFLVGDESLRQKAVQNAVSDDVYGAALCGSYGMAETA